MRYRVIASPKFADTRIRSGFLFFPKNIRGDGRWLERATWKEQFWYEGINGPMWLPLHWIDASEPTAATPASRSEAL